MADKYAPNIPLQRVQKGYQVFWTCEIGWLKNSMNEQCWQPVMNSYGYPYSLLGFAINRAKDFLNWNKSGRNVYAYVYEQSEGEIVWKSWSKKNEI